MDALAIPTDNRHLFSIADRVGTGEVKRRLQTQRLVSVLAALLIEQLLKLLLRMAEQSLDSPFAAIQGDGQMPQCLLHPGPPGKGCGISSSWDTAYS